jgi:hypothetical protein
VGVCDWSCALQAGTRNDIRLAAKTIPATLWEKETTGAILFAPEQQIEEPWKFATSEGDYTRRTYEMHKCAIKLS